MRIGCSPHTQKRGRKVRKASGVDEGYMFKQSRGIPGVDGWLHRRFCLRSKSITILNTEIHVN